MVALFEPLPAALVVVALGVLVVSALPRLLHDRALSFPMVLVGIGAAAFALPLGLPDPDPVAYPNVAEHLTEIVVIVSLTNVGLRLDRRISWRGWTSTWRLLGIAMPLTVAGVALLGSWMLGLGLAAAVLIGASVSPTDPVLAAEVQVGGPGQGSEDMEAAEEEPDEPAEEDEVRFGLTSEAGLNDALAFPYTNLALALAVMGPGWLGEWVAVDVVYKLGVGVVAGVVVGRLLSRLILAMPASTSTGKALTGVSAVAVTLAAYGVAEWFGGYGFLATFLAAHVLRHSDSDHEYHASLVVFVEQLERLLIVVVLLAVGGILARPALLDLSWTVLAFALVVVFAVRPIAGGLALVGGRVTPGERAALAFFGIRGVGSFYYVAYAVNEGSFAEARTLWTILIVVAVVSIVVHGVTATAALDRLDRARGRKPGRGLNAAAAPPDP